MKSKSVIDTEKMSKKYRTNVDKIIKAWRKGKSDMEVSTLFNIDYFVLKQLRYDIESEHLKRRYNKIARATGSLSKRPLY